MADEADFIKADPIIDTTRQVSIITDNEFSKAVQEREYSSIGSRLWLDNEFSKVEQEREYSSIGSRLWLDNAFSKAEQEPVFKDGEFSFITKDKRASSHIRWGNVGYTICFQKSKGSPKTVEHVTIFFKEHKESEASKIIDTVSDPVYNFTYYRIKENLIRREFDKKYGEGYYDSHAEDGCKIYFNNIFMTYWGVDENGMPKEYKGPFTEKIEIENVPGILWPPDTLADFAQHFDIAVTYHSAIFTAEVVYYIEGTNTVISASVLSSSKWGKKDTPIQHLMAANKSYDQRIYTLIKSYYTPIGNSGKVYNVLRLNNDQSNMEEVRQQNGVILYGGTRFVGIMRLSPQEEEIFVSDLTTPVPSGVVRAEKREKETFDVLQGIPTSEELYVNVISTRYLVGYRLKKVSGFRDYKIKASRTYQLRWTESKGDMSESVIIRQDVTIRRHFEYWLIDNLDVFALRSANVKNYALADGNVLLSAKNYKPPTVDYDNSVEVSSHLSEPMIQKEYIIPPAELISVDKPDIPAEDFSPYIENHIDQIRVKNDYLSLDKKIILSNEWCIFSGTSPKNLSVDSGMVGADVLYERNLTIDPEKRNGVHHTEGEIRYIKLAGINSQYRDEIFFDIRGMNSVLIHTPVYCDAKIENMNKNNQKLLPDPKSNSLVLDTEFGIYFSVEGEHVDIPGYGVRNYGKYIEMRQVRFPFDVYSGEAYLKKDTWHDILMEETRFYLPIWVKEGIYQIDFRSISINGSSNHGIHKTESIRNTSFEHYTAIDAIQVEISGRIYGFHLFDIMEYPIWEQVFRKQNSLERSGFNYTVGSCDQNGQETNQNSEFTIPLTKGSHPQYKNIGPIKYGYPLRFSLTTIGNMDSSKDYIRISPSFYFMSYDGTRRLEADLYYSELTSGKAYDFVKMGSELDKTNVKALRLGDPYLAIPYKEVDYTAQAKGLTPSELMAVTRNVYTYTNLMIPSDLQILTGEDHHKSLNIEEPENMEAYLIGRSKQEWYFEYYLPSKVYAVPKGFDPFAHSQNNIVDGNEDFFMKDGYILIHFNIETIQNDKRHLSYTNISNSINGYCNMWKKEGFLYRKADSENTEFSFLDGDSLLYYADYKLNSSDFAYDTGGTH